MQDSGFVIPDPDEIRPSRTIPQREIDEIIRKHVQLAHSVLPIALEIGFKLRCWHDLIPHGQWLDWCRRKLPNISERSIQVYLRLWKHSDLIQAKIKSADAADLTEIPSIQEALTWISSKRSEQPEQPKRSKPSKQSPPEEKRFTRIVRDVPAEMIPSHPEETPQPTVKFDGEETRRHAISCDGEMGVLRTDGPLLLLYGGNDSKPRSVRSGSDICPDDILITADQLAQLCPACRALLKGIL